MKLTWKVSQLFIVPQAEGLENVVVRAHFTATGEQDGKAASYSGSVEFAAPDPEAFTPLAELQEPAVVGWVQAALGDAAIANIQSHLAGIIAPEPDPVSVPLPWVAGSE